METNIIDLIKIDASKRQDVFNERIEAYNMPSSFKGYLSDVLYAVENSPELQQCSPSSIVDSAIKACGFGLTIGGNIAHIVPTGKKANFRIGYNGYILLLSKVAKVTNTIFQVVYQDDIFNYEESDISYSADGFKLSGANFKYKRTNKTNNIQGAFAFISLEDGNSQIVYMSLDECEKRTQIYDRNTKSFIKNNNVFHKNYKEDMLALVPLRKLARTLGKYYNCQVLLQCISETEENINNDTTTKLQTIIPCEDITLITKEQITELYKLINDAVDNAQNICEIYNVNALTELTSDQFNRLKENLTNKISDKVKF